MKKSLFIFAPLCFVLGSMIFMQGFALQFCFVVLFLSLFFLALTNLSKKVTIQYFSMVLFIMGFMMAGAEAYHYMEQSSPSASSTTPSSVVSKITG